MSKYVLIPDSFKGTMSSMEVCEYMREAILALEPDACVISLPVADGGEGTVDALLCAAGGQRIPARVQGPFGQETDSFYGVLGDGTAVIETAAAAGLPMVGESRDPELTTTYGVGQLIALALHGGARKIILGLGGSATNDGGCGMASALGVRFQRADGGTFTPTGGTLADIAAIDASALHPRLSDAQLLVMCDVDNPLCGANGAAHIFAPQKGADADMVARLDAGLYHMAQIVRRDLGVSISALAGAGAAGGMGGGAVAYLGAELKMGIDIVLDAVRFDTAIADADLVLTGEGRMDGQSLRGKVVAGVARRCRAQRKPVIALTGCLRPDAGALYAAGLTAAFSINQQPQTFEEAVRRSPDAVRATVDSVLRCFHAFHITGEMQ